MTTIRISRQVVLNPGRQESLQQAMGVREMIDKVIFRNHYMRYIKEKLEYYPLLENHGSDGIRLIVWVDYRGKDVERLLKCLWRKSLQAYLIKEVGND